MKLDTRIRFVFCLLLLVFFWGTSDSVVLGVRLSGEKGVAPVAPEPSQKAQRPAPVKPPVKVPPETGPVDVNKEKATIEKVDTETKKGKEEAKSDERYVTIDFDNVDIAIFVKFISELTGKNFVIDKGVRGKVTIISPTKISVKDAYKVFESVLEVHGYTAVPAGNVIKIVPSVQARGKNIETRLRKGSISPEDKVVTQLIPLKYADPDELKKVFSPLISKSSVIVSYPAAGMLIVTDVLSNIKRLLGITKAIDVEGIGEQISVVPLEYATASVLAKSLESLFQRTAKTRGRRRTAYEAVIKVIPDERTNVLVILASEADTSRIKRLIKLLDKETPRGKGDIHVYYLQNANAEDLAKVLMAIPSKQAKGPIVGKAPVISKEVQIVADKATNSLVITANKPDYHVLEDVIKKLDITRRMVYIEALIMEVSVNKQFDLGVEWQGGDDTGSWNGRKIVTFGASKPGDSILPSVNTTTGQVGLPSGFSFGVMGEGITIGDVMFPSIGAVIRAYRSDSDVHILSTPQILTTDNEEAEIKVGKNIPFITRQERSTANVDYSNYEFKDVGVTLNITPQINQERFVRLKISQELSQIVSQEQIGLPTTLTRQAKTTVVVKDSNTVVIGGLIGQTLNETSYNVPCVGSIPVLGWLFKSLTRSRDKTNLFIFLTPHIIENPEEAKKVYQQKKEQIDLIQEGVIKMYKSNHLKSFEIEGE